MMIYKVITIALTICAAEHEMKLSQLLSKQELGPPAQPFRRHIIFPMILKYAKLDEYNPPSKKSRSVRSADANTILQYAPLHQGMRDSTNPTPTHSTPVVQPSWLLSEINRHYSKSLLEPRTKATDKKCHAPDYGLKEPSATRSPGYNAVYRSQNSERTVIEKPDQPRNRQKISAVQYSLLSCAHINGNYEKPIGINLDLKSLTSTSEKPLNELPFDNKNKFLTVTNEHLSPKSLETDLPVQDKLKRYAAHAKLHRLHLNIARVYSPGQVPPKPPAYAHANPDHFHTLQNPQVHKPQLYPDQIKNTMLYPINRHRSG